MIEPELSLSSGARWPLRAGLVMIRAAQGSKQLALWPRQQHHILHVDDCRISLQQQISISDKSVRQLDFRIGTSLFCQLSWARDAEHDSQAFEEEPLKLWRPLWFANLSKPVCY